MNLAMQLRRAFITLGLAALAMACVAARTAATTDIGTALPLFESRTVSSLPYFNETPTPVVKRVHLGPRVLVSKSHDAHNVIRVRYESVTRG